MIIVVLFGALTLNNLIVFSGLASGLSSFVTNLYFTPMATMAIILLIYLALGCFLDALAIIRALSWSFSPEWWSVRAARLSV